jgi:uncharacterized iron-regulated protein
MLFPGENPTGRIMKKEARHLSSPPGLLFPVRLVAILCLFAVAACSPANQLLGDPQDPYPLKKPAKIGEIVHLPTGMKVSISQMMDVAGNARIVYVGETHDNPASHRLELQVLKTLANLHSGRQALGMEMFNHSQQPVLDLWVAGKLDEKTFLKESRWYENWGMNFAYYRDLLNFARRRHIPVIALNAEKNLVEAVQDKAPAQLEAGERKQLPELDLSDPYERAMVAAFFRDHIHGGMKLDRFIRVQALWDETMASSVARYLSSPAGKDMHLMVIAGSNHVNYGFGIPRRAFRRLPASYILIGGQEIDIPPDMRDRLMNVEMPDFPMLPYDFLAYLAYEKLPEEARLGVMVEPAPGGTGIVVKKVLPRSNGEHAGLKNGDILLDLDNTPLKDSLDLVYAVRQKHPGDHGTLLVERHGKKLEVDVLFQAGAGKHPRIKQ